MHGATFCTTRGFEFDNPASGDAPELG